MDVLETFSRSAKMGLLGTYCDMRLVFRAQETPFQTQSAELSHHPCCAATGTPALNTSRSMPRRMFPAGSGACRCSFGRIMPLDRRFEGSRDGACSTCFGMSLKGFWDFTKVSLLAKLPLLELGLGIVGRPFKGTTDC